PLSLHDALSISQQPTAGRVVDKLSFPSREKHQQRQIARSAQKEGQEITGGFIHPLDILEAEEPPPLGAAQDRRGHRLKQLLTAQLGIAFGLQYRKPLKSFLPRGIGSAAPTVIAATDEYPRPQFGSPISTCCQEGALPQSWRAEQKHDLASPQIRYLLQQIRQPPE